MKPIILAVSLHSGHIGLSTDARKDILRRMGTDNVRNIRNATREDVEWVRGMGGYVPDGRVVKDARK